MERMRYQGTGAVEKHSQAPTTGNAAKTKGRARGWRMPRMLLFALALSSLTVSQGCDLFLGPPAKPPDIRLEQNGNEIGNSGSFDLGNCAVGHTWTVFSPSGTRAQAS